MWSQREGNRHEGRPPRVSNNSDVVIMDDRPVATISDTVLPSGSNLNVTKSSRVHIGPKFVSVTQNVQNKEVILDVPLTKYVWEIIKNSSRTERIACAIALIILIVCISLIVYFTIQASQTTEIIDRAPHEWRISRDMWLAQNFSTEAIVDEFEPLMLVIIQHSVSPECTRFIHCAAELRNIQSWFIKYHGYDIPYNFLIGNDGRVYDGCGWGKEGAHTRSYNRCSVGIGFIGDYREEITRHSTVTEAQLNRTLMLLDEGVRLGYLRHDYKVVGAKDLRDTASPGSNLHNAIKQWEHFDHENRFVNLTCEEMYEKFPYKTD